jgi:hypothetical protein
MTLEYTDSIGIGVAFAVVAGLANAVAGLWWVGRTGSVGLLGVLWGGLGLTATVTVPLVLLTRFSLVSPLVTVGLFVYGFYLADTGPTAGEPFVGYVLLWPALVVAGVVLGAGEYVARSQLGLFPPERLVV